MAVNGLSNSIYGSSHTRYTGLASGLDVDQLVEGMTAGTRNKIAKQYQQKQLLSWKQDAYRSVSSKLIEFSRKYMSYGSSTNLMTGNFFGKNIVSSSGTNSKYVSVSGSSAAIDNLSLVGVKQLAQDHTLISKNNVSDLAMSSGEFAMEGNVDSDKLAGSVVRISRGSSSYSVTLDPTLDYSSIESAVESINKSLANTDIGGNQNLGSKIEASIYEEKDASGNVTGKYIQLGLAAGNTNDSNTIKITGGSKAFFETLGISDSNNTITSASPTLRGTEDLTDSSKLIDKNSFIDTVSGKKMSFTYNGVTKAIEMPKELADLDSYAGGTVQEKFQNYLQKQLDDNFGKGRIQASVSQYTKPDGSGGNIKDDNGNDLIFSKMEFKTMKKDSSGAYVQDNTSVLKVTTADSGLLGRNGAFKMNYGESNRLNLNSSVKDMGLNTAAGALGNAFADGKTQFGFEINGVVIDKTVDGKAFDENTSMNDIMKAINASDAKVKVSYLETSDKFSIVSTDPGASGNIEFGTYTGDGTDPSVVTDLGELIFGKNADIASNYDVTEGQDAIIYVDYDGVGGQDPVELTRSSNTFDVDGLKVTVNNTFGDFSEVNPDGSIKAKPDADGAVTFSAKADVDKITTAITDMVKEYNEIIKLANDMVTEKRNRSYMPLTDEQKAEMSESDIENWEKRAKEGMLFNDADLRSFTNAIRPIFSQNAGMIQALKDIGITTSSSREDNGKLVLDETKLKAALEADPDNVKNLFTASAETKIDPVTGKTVTVSGTGGVMTQVKRIFDTYAATEGVTKGIFVEKAGSPYSPLSMLKNSITKQIDDIDDYMDDLRDRLVTEQTRYYNKFTQLEKLTQQMNSQSSWFTQQMGGGQ